MTDIGYVREQDPDLQHDTLAEHGVQFRSLRQNIDTTTASGRLTFPVFAALAQFERDLLRERTAAGLTRSPDGGPAAATAAGPGR